MKNGTGLKSDLLLALLMIAHMEPFEDRGYGAT